MQADVNGSGGYLSVYRGVGFEGFRVDGNASGAGEPTVSVIGSARSAVFDMIQSGTNAVQLPASAIHAMEIADEPGATSYAEGGATGIALTGGSYNVLASCTIVNPSAGYVLAIATCQAREIHTTGTTGTVDFGVSTSPSSVPTNQDVSWTVPSAWASATVQIPVTVQCLFPAGAGSQTYYFLGYPISGSFYCYDFQLTLLFIPTSYGVVAASSGTATPGAAETVAGPSLSPAGVASARSESEAANAARIERELAEMRAQLEAVKSRLENK